MRHFVNRYVKQNDRALGFSRISDDEFAEWFAAMDQNGDGSVSIVEVANRMYMLFA
jgi:Ca2+-binding EF-hand superfamily protein